MFSQSLSTLLRSTDTPFGFSEVYERSRSSRFARAYLGNQGDPVIELHLLRTSHVTKQEIKDRIEVFGSELSLHGSAVASDTSPDKMNARGRPIAWQAAGWRCQIQQGVQAKGERPAPPAPSNASIRSIAVRAAFAVAGSTKT